MGPVISVLWEDWADQSLPLPAYQTAGAAGADLCANFPPEARAAGRGPGPAGRGGCPPGEPGANPPGPERHGISVPNTPGTIDSDYRGPLGVALINLGSEPYTIRHGDRVAQVVVAPVVQAGFAVVGTLDETERGTGGFGSTGFGTVGRS